MKHAILLMLLLTCVSVATHGQVNTELKRVTLFSPLGNNHDGTRAAINFENGERGIIIGGPKNLYDLSYGTLMINQDNDWFEVSDPRSQLADLGKKNWADFKETPSFPKSKEMRQPSLSPPKVLDASAGSKNYAPYNQFAQARFEHIYLMRVFRSGKVLYVMFRVEKLDSNSSCMISWRAVPPPRVDNEN